MSAGLSGAVGGEVSAGGAAGGRAIGGRTRLAGVVGWPVAHSRSPLLHNHWLARYGIDGAYLPLPVAPGRLEAALRGLQAAGFAGVNVTVPHKEAAAALCDRLEGAAVRTGSANTLVFAPSGEITGTSSDGEGFLASLRAARVDPNAGPVLLLGAGGAALAIAAALRAAGVHELLVANRTHERAEALARRVGGAAAISWEDWAGRLADVALLVNTTSLGMEGHGPLAADLSRASPRLVVADIVYQPRDTALLRQARAGGLRTVEGIGMLAHQAVPGFEAWFGVRPAVDEVVIELLCGHGRESPGRAGAGRAGAGKAGAGEAGAGEAGAAEAGAGDAGSGDAGSGRANPGRANPGRANPGRP